MEGLAKKLTLSALLGIVVFFAMGAITDFGKTAAVIALFDWGYLPAAIALTLSNYLLRFVKWHFYLRRIGLATVGLRCSALIFFSAFSMVMTPGKVGEWLKSYLLRERYGTPVGVSAPIVIAERLTDGLAMVLLACGGLVFFGYAWQLPAAALILALAVIVISQHPGLAEQLLRLGGRIPLVSGQLHHLRDFSASARELLRPRNLTPAVAIGVISWAGESVAFYLVLLGLGLQPSLHLLVQATFILAVSTLVGALALMPGGLGVADGSIAGLLLLLGVTQEPSLAAAATLIVRLCTLWFGVAIGVVTLLVWVPKLTGSSGNKDLVANQR